MKEKIKIEELNSIDLLKLIYEEVKNTRSELNEKMDNIYKELDEKINTVYNELNEKIKHLDEKIDNVYRELKEEINSKFNYLNEKVNNTKNVLVTEIAEELKDFTAMLERTTNNLNKKIDNEIEDRKIDVSKIREFNKIIINDIRSRVGILEEESEKYNLK